ncbi:hypothetical protein SteCoe_7890 [Stentor coeruleus]|uniref:Uncharacterized protein n=1 Tax=Stentor coeruleus TaxID=5963 RepID=A0A1R2CLN5_9CILI|nr:hypothetical protein SteCoe_7890 [Stentor coeruleus]
MNEEHLIKFLSEESDKIDCDAIKSCYNFDIDLCGWKDVKEESIRKNMNLETPKFRIRVIETRGSLTRSSSSKGYSGTVSSSNDSRSNSPNSDIGHYTKRNKGVKNLNKRKIISSIAFKNEETPVVFEDIKPGLNIIRIHKISNPQRTRKPIKVFRLPRVEQGEEE